MTSAANDNLPNLNRALATLFISYACPWSHRVLIAGALSDLGDVVRVIDVQPELDGVDWRLQGGHFIDHYREFESGYLGKATVPLMVDLQTSRIVCNELADLLRLSGTGMSGGRPPLFRHGRAVDCETWNRRFQHDVNERDDQFGFAATSEQKASKTTALVEVHRSLVSEERPLEPDWRLWCDAGALRPRPPSVSSQRRRAPAVDLRKCRSLLQSAAGRARDRGGPTAPTKS